MSETTFLQTISNITRDQISNLSNIVDLQSKRIDTLVERIKQLEAEPLKFDKKEECPFVVGEFYKTRGGEKVRFDRWCYTEEKAYFRRISDNFSMTTNPDGRYSCFKCCDNDVIGPWVEELQLEEEVCPFVVGEFYKTRDGGKVEFLKFNPKSLSFTCVFSHGSTSINGSYYYSPDDFDVIGPWKEELQLEVGKTYLDENGNKVLIYYGPDRKADLWGIVIGDCGTLFYKENGKSINSCNLVSEVK